MACRVTYPERSFIKFKCSTLFPFRKIAIASKKYQPGGKHGARAVRNSVTSVNINIKIYKGCAQKTREAPLVCQVRALFAASSTLPPTLNPSGAVSSLRLPKLCSTSRHLKLSGCAAWSLHFGLCHVVFLEFKWELPPSFTFGV